MSHLIVTVAGQTGADTLAMGSHHHSLVVLAHIGDRVPGQPGLRAHTLAQLRPPEAPVTLVTRACHAGDTHGHPEVLEEVVTVGSVAPPLTWTDHKPLTLGTGPLLQEGVTRAIDRDCPVSVTLTVLGKLDPGFWLLLFILEACSL